tara:strand:- start:771 stop:1091 length:321 start_codon:yes stop_codon:yes gene_type:complete
VVKGFGELLTAITRFLPEWQRSIRDISEGRESRLLRVKESGPEDQSEAALHKARMRSIEQNLAAPKRWSNNVAGFAILSPDLQIIWRKSVKPFGSKESGVETICRA